MRFRRLAPFIILLGTAAIAACGGGDPTPTGCFDPVGGRLVEVPCDDNGGPPTVPTPTSTTAPSDGITPPPTVSGDGAQVFLASGCTACHTIDSLSGARGAIGPDLTRIGARGDAFVRESIVDPNAVIAPDCPFGSCQPGLMPQDFEQRLSQEELDALVAYLLTLR